MPRRATTTLLLALLALSFTGCIDEDTPRAASTSAETATATASAGAVTGQVITVDLEIGADITVELINRTGPAARTQTDTLGRYTLNDIAPGTYRLQIADPCCRPTTRQVSVVAGDVSVENFQLERLTQADLRTPHVVVRQWDGLVACSVSVLSQSDEACGTADTNRDERHRFNVTEGIVELVVGMDWEQSGTSLMPDLKLRVWQPGGYETSTTYGVLIGPPPLIAHIRDQPGNNPTGQFALINETLEIEFRVYSGNTNVVYQQPFTIHWHEFYHHSAPTDHNPIPDG